MSSIPWTDAKNKPARYGLVFDGDFKPVIMDFQTGKFFGFPGEDQAYRWSNSSNAGDQIEELNNGFKWPYWYPLNKPQSESVSHWGLLSNLVPNYK